ncbi:hypothetical protein [Catenulispora yoronensis]|uniref:hypothetical protein n=1 Tax=Catenulispora yoronensis TaxID=450799 RepID=UPI0031E3F6B7
MRAIMTVRTCRERLIRRSAGSPEAAQRGEVDIDVERHRQLQAVAPSLLREISIKGFPHSIE